MKISKKIVDKIEQKGYNKAIDDFYDKLLEASEYARPVGWSTEQCVVLLARIEDIVDQLKKGAANGK